MGVGLKHMTYMFSSLHRQAIECQLTQPIHGTQSQEAQSMDAKS